MRGNVTQHDTTCALTDKRERINTSRVRVRVLVQYCTTEDNTNDAVLSIWCDELDFQTEIDEVRHVRTYEISMGPSLPSHVSSGTQCGWVGVLPAV